MDSGMIAVLILIGVIAFIGCIINKYVLFVVTWIALFGGFIAIIALGMIDMWYVFFGILWELFWIVISFTPMQYKIWTQPIK